MMKWLDPLRKFARPVMTWSIFLMVLPLAVGVGVAEMVKPGAGVKFANAALVWLNGLPDNFWLFAFGVFGVVSVGRSFGQDRKAEAEEKAVETAKEEEGNYVPR